jgi:hypothetical protein
MLTREQIEEAVKEWQQRLNLSHWTVVVRWDLVPANPDNGAEVHVVEGRDWANVRFEHNILSESPESVNHWIAHELTHLHTDYIYRNVYKMMDRDEGEVRMLLNFLHMELECVTDRISMAMAKSMPLAKSLQCKA